MCLSRREEFKPRGVGYKVMSKGPRGYDGLYQFVFRYYRLNREYKRRTDLYSGFIIPRDRYLYDSRGERYQVGFHIYTTLKDAKSALKNYRRGWGTGSKSKWRDSLVIVKVKYRDVLATGVEDRRRVVVTEYMTILEEIV